MTLIDISALLNGVEQRAINFQQVIEFIDTHYDYTPVSFVNGLLHNGAGENAGSAKVFGFAKLHRLTAVDTLKLFAEHYRQVRATPQGSDHANIRNFMYYGWQAFLMEHNALTPKNRQAPAEKTTKLYN